MSLFGSTESSSATGQNLRIDGISVLWPLVANFINFLYRHYFLSCHCAGVRHWNSSLLHALCDCFGMSVRIHKKR